VQLAAYFLSAACCDGGEEAADLFVKAVKSPAAFSLVYGVLGGGEAALSDLSRDTWYDSLCTAQASFPLLQSVDVAKERNKSNVETVETSFQARLRALLHTKDLDTWKKVFFFFFAHAVWELHCV
jgi:hypothetical protein